MIVHFDADAFFASVEQAADKKLRGRPIAVGGEKRGIIASASYEARKLGIYTPMPTVRARKLCPSLIVLPGDFEKYELFSRLMISYAYDFTPIVEPASIDEGYLDLHGAKQSRACDVAATIQKAISQSLKISVSMGVGINKLVSQIASKLRKPHCFIEVGPGHEQSFLWPLKNEWLPQVGPHLAATLNTAGLCTVGHVAATPVDELSLLVGKYAPTLHEYSLGIDARPVVCDSLDAKSYGTQDSFNEDTTDTVFIIARLRAMADSLMTRVRADKKSIRTVTLRLRYNDMDEVTRSNSLDEPTDLEHDVYPLLTGLLKRAWERRVSVRLVGLKFTKVYEASFHSCLLLEQTDVTREKHHELASIVDALRHEKLSIMRGHDLWLKQHRDAPRQLLPKPKKAVEDHGTGTHRVLRERHGNDRLVVNSSLAGVSIPMLNVKSCYSFQGSTLTIAAIIDAALAHGVTALAITDPNLHGAVPFFQAACAAGIKPIIGAELKVGENWFLAYAKNTLGYQNLCRLLSFEKLTEKDVQRHHYGLIIVPADTADFALPEIRYHKPSDRVFFEILQSMKTLTLLQERHPDKRKGDFAFHAQSEWIRRYSSQALKATQDIADQCEFAFDFKTLRFPRYVPADGSTPTKMLHRLAHEGLNRRYRTKAAQHLAQLDEELSIIGEVGYEEYFLTVWDMLQKCKQIGINWITRGSAADSLVCYSLAISNVCPIRFELYFKRFLNRDRMALQKLPDIDIDFAHDRKDDVVEMLLRHYGPEHAAIVGGFNTFHARSAFGDVAKVLGVSENEVRRLNEHMPWTSAKHAGTGVSLSPECQEGHWKEEPVRTALLMAGMLDGFPRYAKMHPCGVVLSRDPIRHHSPTFTSSKRWPTTHFDMDAVEAVGLIKLDILAQGGLAVLRDAQDALRGQGLNVDMDSLEVGMHGGSEKPPRFGGVEPWSDDGVWQMIATGNGRGVHHIESPAMTSLACMADVRDIDRLVAIVSVIRPGAANGLKKSQFARRAQGLDPVEYIHESLAPILRSTFGVIAYEEHILQICEAFAGMPAGRGDMLRRALVKQDMAKIQELQLEFFTAALLHGRDGASIKAVWELVAGFQGYAFCRAHSTAYAVEAYQGAYFKHYHPAEFMAAVLTNGKGFYTPLVYTLEARRLGIGFLHPCVNICTPSFTVVHATVEHGTPAASLGKAIRVPLLCIKDLSEAMLARWQQELTFSPFTSVQDFCRRVRPDGPETLNLIRTGAFDGLGGTRTEHFWHCLHTAKNASTGPGWLFKGTDEENIRATFREEPTTQQKLDDETELLGYTISGHPLDRFTETAWNTYCPIDQLRGFMNQRVTVAGLIIVSRSHHQQNGLPMKFISICDRTGIVECEIFAAAYRATGLATIRYPVVEVLADVKPFDNETGFTLQVLRVAKPRARPTKWGQPADQ